MPIAHIGLSVSDMKASRAFYLSALAPLGYKVYKESEHFVGMAKLAPDFWLVDFCHQLLFPFADEFQEMLK